MMGTHTCLITAQTHWKKHWMNDASLVFMIIGGPISAIFIFASVS